MFHSVLSQTRDAFYFEDKGSKVDLIKKRFVYQNQQVTREFEQGRASINVPEGKTVADVMLVVDALQQAHFSQHQSIENLRVDDLAALVAIRLKDSEFVAKCAGSAKKGAKAMAQTSADPFRRVTELPEYQQAVSSQFN